MSGSERTRWLALLLIAVGAVWLLAAVGFVPTRFAQAALSLWPLLLVGIGLDLILDERVVFGVPYTAVAALLMLVIGLLFPGLAGPGQVQVQRFSEPIGNARRAEADLDLSSAPAEVGALSGEQQDEQLIRAEIRDSGRIVFDVTGERVKQLTLARRDGAGFGGTGFGGTGLDRGTRSWQVALTPQLPLSLTLRGSSGPARLDLARLDIGELRAEFASGGAVMSLPLGGPERTSVDIEGRSGSLELTVPEGARLDVTMDTGSGATRMVVGRGSDLTLVLETSSGALDLDLPDGAPVRLEVEDDGSGALDVAPWLERLSGRDDEGVWQSGDYREGVVPGILIRIEDVGSGNLRFR